MYILTSAPKIDGNRRLANMMKAQKGCIRHRAILKESGKLAIDQKP